MDIIKEIKPVKSVLLPPLSENDINRFWKTVAFTANPDKCWNWQGKSKVRGYGRFCVSINPNIERTIGCPRVSYYLHNKVDPIGYAVLHTCDNPTCVNPNHLYLGTNKENTVDMMRKGRGYHRKGQDHGMAKLSDVIVSKIKKEYIKGNGNLLANKYGVNQSVISRIINNKSWAYVI